MIETALTKRKAKFVGEVGLAGARFGRLLVKTSAPRQKGRAAWLCSCDCGAQKIILQWLLKAGKTQSCGCLRREMNGSSLTHGLSKTSVYNSWIGIHQRCYNENNKRYANYGGRGIKVCDRWRGSFENFLSDMGPRPKGMSIDRIDNDGNYEPGNCRWATTKQQTRNYSRNRMVTIGDETAPLVVFVDRLGLDYPKVLIRIIRLGWSPQRALGLE